MTRPRWLTFANVVSVAALLLVGFDLLVVDRKQRRDQRWNIFLDFVTYREAHLNTFQPTVGTIQFMQSGYSITLDSVSYRSDGLHLVGKIGNPKSVNVNSLTLTFTVEKSDRDKAFAKAMMNASTWDNYDDSVRVTAAQVSVGMLRAGGTVPFTVLLPNVTKANPEYEYHVQFSGERYWY